MSCLLVTPDKVTLKSLQLVGPRRSAIMNLKSNKTTLRFHKLSKLLKQRTKELMAKFLGFFRKSNKSSYEDLTLPMLDHFLNELSNSRPKSWVCMDPPIIQMKPMQYKEVPYDDDCEGDLYEEGCECEECCNYREEHDLDDNGDYTESEYSFKVDSKPSEPKKWYEEGAIVLPF